MKDKKGGLIGGFTVDFWATIIIIIILFIYFFFSFTVRELSSVRNGIVTKYKETNLGDYFYIDPEDKGQKNTDSFEFLYRTKYSRNTGESGENQFVEEINCGASPVNCPYKK